MPSVTSMYLSLCSELYSASSNSRRSLASRSVWGAGRVKWWNLVGVLVEWEWAREGRYGRGRMNVAEREGKGGEEEGDR